MTKAVLFMGDLIIVARQLRLITEAKRRGYAPLLVITPDTDPVRFERYRADPSHPLSLLEDVVLVPEATVEHVLPAIQPLLRRYDVRAVLCIGDLFVEPVGLVGDCLGLPGTGATAARVCRNKLLQRTTLPHLSPRWIPVTPGQRSTVDASELRFPVVVKPVARFSSLGVRKVDDPAALPAVLATYGPDETVLVEERVVGPEFSVEALTRDGEVFWTGVTAKQTNEVDSVYFTEMGHVSPAPITPAELDALTVANADALRKLQFRDGITHLEFRLVDGVPVLMEAAARLPGDGIMFLWELATGQPLEPAMLDLALGTPSSHPAPVRRAVQVYLEHPHGILRDVASSAAPVSWVERDARWPAFSPAPADAPPRTLAVLVTRLAGERLGPQTDSEARSTSVILDAPLDEPIPPLVKAAADTVAVVVEPAAHGSAHGPA
ncbi:ATP-grasp domain-containing protein [Dactylosporangium sp. AC04546]|uniref:ATP-grasp domain-containing protein n=1 Tax=Dactylosporangium sp. AC04546 TaxID=2862460 RepID=UPI001EDF70AA|nr:ATP-grasp domain-containing protein [Dactylosporangium sp. AC04546]WVK79083.1 ATP-grasp domain-containing protein [Dactylosporangium sp. AC04546]